MRAEVHAHDKTRPMVNTWSICKHADFKPTNTVISLAHAVVFGNNYYLQTFPPCLFARARQLLFTAGKHCTVYPACLVGLYLW